MRQWILIALLLMAGCAAPSDDKSPEELLSLSVAGLSGIDHYLFSGATGIAIADGNMPQPLTFKGVVEDHNRIRMSAGLNGSTGEGMPFHHPLKLLEHIQAHADTITLMPSQSGNRTATLRVELDGASARRQWSERLRGEFDKVAGTGRGNAKGKTALANQVNASTDLEREWRKEVDRSRRRLDEMLRTLNVQSTYTVIVDRVKMLPLRLQEQTQLHYEAGGEPYKESRKTDIRLRTLPEGRR